MEQAYKEDFRPRFYLKTVDGSLGGVVVREGEMRDFIGIHVFIVIVGDVDSWSCRGDGTPFLNDLRIDVGSIGADGALQRMRNSQTGVLNAAKRKNNAV